jgi:ribosome maturation factor RimP
VDRYEITEELRKFIDDFLTSRGLELVELIYRREGRDQVLRVFTDRPEGGISLGECAQVNRRLGEALDENMILQEEYNLEVSSPGLDRWLSNKKDFLRVKGKEVKFFLREQVDGKIEWDGVITSVDEQAVCIETKSKPLVIPLSIINKGKQII